MGHPSVSWKSTSRKVRRSQASFSSGRSRNTPSKTGTASGGASSDSSARASMGAHYRHTTPEMAARVVTAIQARLTVLVHAAEDTLERSRPTCHAPCSDRYGPRFLAILANGGSEPFRSMRTAGWSRPQHHDQPGGDQHHQRCRLDRGCEPAGERLTGSVDDPLTHLGRQAGQDLLGQLGAAAPPGPRPWSAARWVEPWPRPRRQTAPRRWRGQPRRPA